MHQEKELPEKMRELIFSQNREALTALLLNKEQANTLFVDGCSALSMAAFAGSIDMAAVLLTSGADINLSDQNDLAYTPLIHAIRQGKTEMAKFLVEKGADLEKDDSRLGTPVLHCAISARSALLEYLLQKGANAESCDADGQTPLHYLCRYAKSWGSGTITETRNGITTEIENTRFQQHTETFKILLQHASQVNRETNYGYTPLHCAAGSDTALFVSLLIEAGADIQHANANGYLPLHAGADKGAAGSCAVLLKHGAQADAADKYGFTALLGAVLGKHEKTVELLLAYGADKSLKAQSAYDKVAAGDTALEVAIKTGNQNIINMLQA